MTQYKNAVFLPKDGGYKKIKIDDIEYIEAQSYKCVLHLTNKKHCDVSCPLAEVLERIDLNQFVRIHRSFAINLDHIAMYYAGAVEMESGKSINIGDSYREDVRNRLILLSPRNRKSKNPV